MRLQEVKFLPFDTKLNLVLIDFEPREIQGKGYALDFVFADPSIKSSVTITKFWMGDASKEYTQQFMYDLGVPREDGEWVLEKDQIIGLSVVGVLYKETYKDKNGAERTTTQLKVIKRVDRMPLDKAAELAAEILAHDSDNGGDDDIPF